MINDIKEILIEEKSIISICKKLGKQITSDYKTNPPVVIAILKGSIPFLADLTRFINLPIEIHYMCVSSYEGATSSTNSITFKLDLEKNITGLDVLIIEDIIDTGLTLSYICDLLVKKGAKSVKVVTLLDKPEGRKTEFVPNYVGFTIPNLFVVGYGLDYKEKYRNLPYVGILKPKVYE